jgi:phosphate transport system protein
MNEHTVKSFDQELQLLDKRVAQMGGLAERLLAHAFDALERRDPKLAESTVASDRAVDQLERELQEQTILMIARRQPMANDLRHIMTVLKIAGDLERIGDLAKNIAKRALAGLGESHPKPLMTGLKHMVELALRQLKTCSTPMRSSTPTRPWACGAKTSASMPCTIRYFASSSPI